MICDLRNFGKEKKKGEKVEEELIQRRLIYKVFDGGRTNCVCSKNGGELDINILLLLYKHTRRHYSEVYILHVHTYPYVYTHKFY